VGFTTREGGHFEGWHGNPDDLYKLFEHDGPLMIIVDEAKSVQRPIFDAIERCTYQHLALVSSAGEPEGEFYESQTKASASYTARFKIPASLCPHADHAKNRDLIARRGLQDVLVRSKVFAEFMIDASGSIIARSAIESLRSNPPQERTYGQDRVVFCDFAAGGDENTIADRRGNRVRLAAAWRDTDTMRAVGQFILEFRNLGLRPEQAGMIYGDNDGLGRVMIDRLHEMGWRIQRWSNGAAAERADEYKNRGAEMWYEGAKKIERRDVILEVDDLTAGQLASRKGGPSSDGRLQVEAKEALKSRMGFSPDRAEVILGAIIAHGGAVVQNLVREATPFEQFAEMQENDGLLIGVPAGMEAGS
jgi:phage terminase large subunit